jgi:hypothetical protein
MLCVGFEPTIPVSERSNTVHALDRSATVTGTRPIYLLVFIKLGKINNLIVKIAVFGF